MLLRRVNSSARTIADLNHRLLSWRVRPYYLHQGDLAEGTGHLRTPLAIGLEILEELRGHTSGLAVPHLAVDLPAGAGKVTLQPGWLLGPGDPGVPPAVATGSGRGAGQGPRALAAQLEGEAGLLPGAPRDRLLLPLRRGLLRRRGAARRQGGNG